MTVTRTDHNQTFDTDGNLLGEEVVEVDITAEAQREETRFVLASAIPTLRDWAATADGHTVTQGNAVATVQAITDNLGIFYARFADLLALQYGDGTG